MRIITTPTQIINVANVAEFRLFHYTGEKHEGKTSKKFLAVELQYASGGGEYCAIIDWNDPQADNVAKAEEYFELLQQWLIEEVGKFYKDFTKFWNLKQESDLPAAGGGIKMEMRSCKNCEHKALEAKTKH
ncbi:MAG: hypothetical protein FWG64_02745, partial [Firmicutes bacterium]|nr:hypothetical protein [Bacillota bacterium]